MLTEADADRVCPLLPPPDALPGVLSYAQALDLGFSPSAVSRRVRAGRWRLILPRTYLTVGTATTSDRLAAVLLFAGAGAALSGRAALWASDVRRVKAPDRVLVLVPPRNRTLSHTWVQVRATRRPIDVQQWFGPRRVEVARAAADEALMSARLDDVRTIVARVVQDGHCTLEELGAELAAGPRNGSSHLRRALAEVGFGAASAPEAEAARILRRAGMTGFVQNARIRLADGSVRVVDFYWPRLRACLEIDSREYHLAPSDWASTWDRHLALSSAALSVIHRPPSALRDPQRFVADVQAWLDGRARDLQRGLPV